MCRWSAKQQVCQEGIWLKMRKFRSFLIEILRLEAGGKRPDNLWQGGNDGLRQTPGKAIGAGAGTGAGTGKETGRNRIRSRWDTLPRPAPAVCPCLPVANSRRPHRRQTRPRPRRGDVAPGLWLGGAESNLDHAARRASVQLDHERRACRASAAANARRDAKARRRSFDYPRCDAMLRARRSFRVGPGGP